MNSYFGAMLRYFEFNGRSTRREYWWFSLGFVVAIVVALYVDIKFLNSENLRSSVLLWFVLFTHAIPHITLIVRRLHDTGKSGWWYWIALIPFVGGLLLFYFVAIKGPEYEAQKYGPDPRDPGALEPNPKRVEQFQQVVIQFGCETERRSRCPGPKLPDASMGDADVAIQVI